MKYGFNYYPAFKYYEEEQVKYVVFKEKNIHNFEGLAKFHEEHPVPIIRLVVPAATILEDENIFRTAIALNAILVLDNEFLTEEVEEVILKCQDKEIPYAFYNPVTKWDVLDAILKLGVHDIIVGEEICFDIKKISKLCKIHNVDLMIYCNVAQNGFINGGITDFFVRPEDVKLYEEYVDCMLIHVTNKLTPVNTLYEIYAHDEGWEDLDSYIITGLVDNFDSRNIMPPFNFGKARLDCGKRCIKGGSCNICMMVKDFCDVMQEKKVTLEEV